MRLGVLAAGAVAILVSGCASQPEDIPILFYSTTPYEGGSCAQLENEKRVLSVRERQLYAVLKERAGEWDTDGLMRVVAKAPMLFFYEGGPAPDTSSYSHLKSKLKAIDVVMEQKECGKAEENPADNTNAAAAAEQPAQEAGEKVQQ